MPSFSVIADLGVAVLLPAIVLVALFMVPGRWRAAPLLIPFMALGRTTAAASAALAGALLAGISAYLLVGNTVPIVAAAPKPVPGKIGFATYNGLFVVSPGVYTKFPAEENVYFSIEAPRSAPVRSTYEVKVSLTREGPMALPYRAGRHMALLDGPPASTYRGIERCPGEPGDKSPADGKRACHTLPEPASTLEFRWLVEAAQTGRLIHDLSLASVNPFPKSWNVDPKAEKSLSGFLRGAGRMLSGVSREVDKARPWSLVISRGSASTSVQKLDGSVRFEDIEIDFAKASLLFPVEILTELGIAQSQLEWLKIVGAVLGALLSAGALTWIFRKRASDFES